MTLDEIKQILDLVREHELAEFELEQEGVKLRIRKKGQEAPAVVVSPAHTLPGPVVSAGALVASPAAAPPATPEGSASEVSETEGVELAMVKAPIVGTFYRAPEPSASPFVSVGDTVRKNQVLCLIEAMKLMNEIVSEYDGEIVQVFVENGQPVQYGERLFAVRAR